MEAFAGLLKEASYVPEYAPIEETLFDMDSPSNQFLSDAQGFDLHGDCTVSEVAHLNTLGDGLMKFNGSIGLSPMEMLPVQSLLDSGASRVFIRRRMIKRLPATPVIHQHGHVRVRLPNRECLTSAGCIQLLLHLGAWMRVIQAWILDSFNYDLILGLDWLQQVNPDINWQSLEMTITNTHGKHQIWPVDMRQCQTWYRAIEPYLS